MGRSCFNANKSLQGRNPVSAGYRPSLPPIRQRHRRDILPLQWQYISSNCPRWRKFPRVILCILADSGACYSWPLRNLLLNFLVGCIFGCRQRLFSEVSCQHLYWRADPECLEHKPPRPWQRRIGFLWFLQTIFREVYHYPGTDLHLCLFHQISLAAGCRH